MAGSISYRSKRKVIDFVKDCTLFMNQFETSVKLNVLSLGTYDVLIGMDRLEQHRVVLNCFDKTFTCLNNEGEMITVKGIPRKTTIRQIYALQLKRVVQKACKVFAVTITNEEYINKEDKLKLEYIPILRGYSNVFQRKFRDCLRKESWSSL